MVSNGLEKFEISRECRNIGRGWEIGKSIEIYISQFPKRSQPIWFSTISEIGKLGNDYRYIFPNFPNNPSPDGPALFRKLGSLNPKFM